MISLATLTHDKIDFSAGAFPANCLSYLYNHVRTKSLILFINDFYAILLLAAPTSPFPIQKGVSETFSAIGIVYREIFKMYLIAKCLRMKSTHVKASISV